MMILPDLMVTKFVKTLPSRSFVPLTLTPPPLLPAPHVYMYILWRLRVPGKSANLVHKKSAECFREMYSVSTQP